LSYDWNCWLVSSTQDSVRYEVFSTIWREMSFSDVFRGIASMSEMKRFCRTTLATAMKYFLPPYSFQIRVGGLYLMFGFYHTQLAVPPVKIRLALKDWDLVQKFLKDSVEAGHHDVVYIYQKLDAAKAIHYTAMPHFLTFQKQRKPKKEPVCAEFLGRTTAVQELISAEIPGGVDQHSEPKTFSQHDKDKNSEDDEEKPEESNSSRSRAQLLSSIKHKSYSNFQEASKSRRHRQPEAMDSYSSGPEQVQETTAGQRKRPPSLRARTWKNLGVAQEERTLQAWLLSVPEQQERVLVKRSNQGEAPPEA
uniref:Small nuclear RNA activating complex, polypeptide 1b n=1 Tax=Lates calcarifer TaxID=8187 RepID=A0A4W6BUR4_LATCA